MQALQETGKGTSSLGPNDGLSPGFDRFEPGCNGSQSKDLPSDKNLYVNAKSKGLDWQSEECIKSINRSFNGHHGVGFLYVFFIGLFKDYIE